jgi:hypothetical protein
MPELKLPGDQQKQAGRDATVAPYHQLEGLQ